MKLKKFKDKSNKRTSIILFTLACIFLVSGVILYRTFAIFEVKTNQNVIKGTIQDPGNIYFAFYQKNEDSGVYEIKKDMPNKNEGYVLDEEASYCGVNGENNPNIKVSVNEDWKIIVSGVTTSRTKCNLYFTKGIFLMGHGVPIVTSGDGLYEIKHEEISAINEGFKETEYRYVGARPKNYITFNGEIWRIIGLVNVMTSEDTVEQRVKIIRERSLGNIAWDSANKNDWMQSSLMKLLNEGEYYQKQGDYLDTGLTEISKHMIEEVTWTLRTTNNNNYELNADLWYQTERESTILWKGNIGLIYASDGIYAVPDVHDGKYWLSYITVYTTLNTFTTSYAGVVTIIFGTNDVRLGGDGVNQPHAIFPTLYLKQNVKIISGTGSANDAYIIAQVIK